MSEPMQYWPINAEAAQKPSWGFISAVATSLLLLYGTTTTRTIQGGDTGELIAVAFGGGVAHPPGYPLWSLFARAVAQLPRFNPAFALGLLAAVFAVGAIVVLYLGLLRWGLSRMASGSACVVLAVSPVMWRYAGVPEVFSLGALLAAALFWTAGRFGGPMGLKRAAVLGAVLGLGLSNHHTIVLLFPLVGLGLYRSAVETKRAKLLVIVVFGTFLGLGLLPYLSLLNSQVQSGWAWGGSMGLGELVDHFLRRSYGTFNLVVDGDAGSSWVNLADYFRRYPDAFSIMLPFGVLGASMSTMTASAALKRRKLSDASLDAFALLTCFVITTVVFLAVVNLRAEGLAARVLERFYVLPDVVFCILVGVGLQALATWRSRLRVYLKAGVVGVVSILIIAHFQYANWASQPTVERYLLNALDIVEPRSVIIGTGDLQVFGFLAVTEVYAFRTDVTYLDLNLLRYRWYYDRMTQRLPELEVPFDADTVYVAHVVATLQRTRPVYVADLPPGVDVLGRAYPVGPLLRLVAPGEPIPAPPVVEELNRAAFARMQLDVEVPETDSWQGQAYRFYERSWRLIAGAYRSAGFDAKADQLDRLADGYVPTIH